MFKGHAHFVMFAYVYFETTKVYAHFSWIAFTLTLLIFFHKMNVTSAKQIFGEA